MKNSDGSAPGGQVSCSSSNDSGTPFFQDPKITNALEGALHFAGLGFRVFPVFQIDDQGICACGEDCSSPGKHPRFSGWKRDATTKEKTIRNWARKYPGTNFAAIPGPGHIVLDLDQRDAHSGFDTFAQLQTKHGATGATLTVKTPSGLHLYFKTDAPLGNGAGKLGEGIDHRGIGGYVLLPGSNHHTGRLYELADDAPALPLPDWIEQALVSGDKPEPKAPAPKKAFAPSGPLPADEIKRQRAYLHAALEGEAQKVLLARKGNRNNTLNTAAVKLYALALSSDLLTAEEIRSRLTDAALTCGLKNRAIQATLKSAKRGARARALPESKPLPKLPKLAKKKAPQPAQVSAPAGALTIKARPMAKKGETDAGSVDEQALAQAASIQGKGPRQGHLGICSYSVKTNEHGKTTVILDYVDDVQCAEAISRELLHEEGALRFWRGEFYRFRTQYGFTQISLPAVRVLVREALCKLRRVDKNGNLLPLKVSNTLINNVTSVLKTLRRVYVPEDYAVARWQQGRWKVAKLCVSAKNGIIDLQTNVFEGHSPDLFCPKASDFEYDPDAKAPTLWLQWLEQIFTPENGIVDTDDVRAKIEALQRYLGLCLCPAALNIQKGLWLTGVTRSGKGTILDLTTALVGKGSTNALDVGQIGERFGLSNVAESSLLTLPELRQDSDLSRRKTIRTFLQLLARDLVRVEKKGKDAFSIKPDVTLLAASNDVPQWEDLSGAIQTRFIYLHTPNSYLKREDPKLFEKLLKEGSGILNWALQGLQKLLAEEEIVEPKSSLAIKGQECSAGLPAYITQRLVFDARSEARQGELYEGYKQWCEDNGESRLSVKHLLNRLKMAAAAAGEQLLLEYRTLAGRLVPYFKGVRLADPLGAGG